MNTESEFQEIGKKMPYTVPDGFFDRITEKTLQEARFRDKIRRKTVVRWSAVAVAASIAALFAIGYLLFTPSPGKYTEQAAREVPAINHPEVPQPEIEVTSDPQPEKANNPQIIAEIDTINKSVENEEINEVLSALTNDELLQLATLYKTDMFLEETENNLQ